MSSSQPPSFVHVDPAGDTTGPPSPCTGVCRMSPLTQFCEGCYRGIDEIVRWGSATDVEKHQIWQSIRQRRHESQHD